MSFRSATCITWIAFLTLAATAPAQPEPEPKDGKVTYAVTLTPAAVPQPVSRTYLLPEYGEAIQGNRVQMFLRCFMEQDNLFGQAESARRERWNAMPLSDLPLSETRNYAGRLVERDMYDAARMTGADWQLLYFLRRDGYKTLLPDVQKMRAIAAVLKTRVRAEIAAGDFAAARHTLKTFFGLGRTMEAHPTLIGQLVGAAITTIAVNAVEEFIQQPGAPNLFWGLTDFPTPFLSLRLALEGERVVISYDVEELKSATEAVPDAMLMKKIDNYQELLQTVTKLEKPKETGAEPDPARWKSGLLARAKDQAEVTAARERLVKAGLKPELVQVWSPLHVVLLDDVTLYEVHRDEFIKCLNLPYWRAKPALDAAQREAKLAIPKTPFMLLAADWAGVKVKQAQTRLDQRIAYLQIMEALRLYAHEHSGALPAALSEIQLSLPVDPVTGQPFEYAVKAGVATLHGVNPNPGVERTNRYYEIRIAK